MPAKGTKALEKWAPLVYRDLYRLAQRSMADERTGHTLQATASGNEAYLRLVDSTHMNWEWRSHFLAVRTVRRNERVTPPLQESSLSY